jgi:hypothetical protein
LNVKTIPLGFKLSILRQFIPVNFQRQLLHNGYQKFYYFEIWIFYSIFVIIKKYF